jgi:hypothetical protein
MITKAYNKPNPKVTSIFFQMTCKNKGVTYFSNYIIQFNVIKCQNFIPKIYLKYSQI